MPCTWWHRCSSITKQKPLNGSLWAWGVEFPTWKSCGGEEAIGDPVFFKSMTCAAFVSPLHTLIGEEGQGNMGSQLNFKKKKKDQRTGPP